jgi:oxygen-dependent protoporphyrinogen oxidase
MRVAVVGGGITGLAAAYQATVDGHDVTLYEAGDRLGGKILTTDFGGLPVEAGPDAFLARVPHAVDLCREVGLGDDLVAPAAGRAFVWTKGRLRPLPEGLVLGVPTNLVGLARSGILSPAGVLRAGLDVVLPRSRWSSDDPSVAEVIAARFGQEAADRLVEPLLGGIHAGRIDRLSLSSSAPQLAAAASRSRSLLLGLRGTPASLDGPVFLTVAGGLCRLVDALADRLGDVRLSTPVDTLPDADRVVLAVPAPAAAALLATTAPEAAADLGAIEHASVALVTLAYPATDLADLAGSGVLVPRVDGRLMTACSFGTNKWPQWSTPGRTVLRVSAGRAGDDRPLHMRDDELVAALHGELRAAVGVPGDGPLESRVTRWWNGFPQYAPGHAGRVARIGAAVAQADPRVRVAGAALHGVGIPACIASGRGSVR